MEKEVLMIEFFIVKEKLLKVFDFLKYFKSEFEKENQKGKVVILDLEKICKELKY